MQPRPGLALKGIAEPVDAARLVDVLSPAEMPARPVHPLVGRTRELALLRQAFDRAVADRTCQLATVLGVAGIGKTRVAKELLTELEPEARILRGRCLSYGDGVTWWPIVELVRSAVGLTGAEGEQHGRERLRELLGDAPDAAEVVERLAPVAGLGGVPGPPQDTAWAVRRLLEQLARDRPLVVVLDDVHWAEPGMLAVIEDVVEWLRDVAVLVLVLARPEFLDDQPTWAGGRINAVTAMLEPLGDSDVAALAAELVGGPLTAETGARVRELTGGNPLYLELLLSMLDEDGRLGNRGASPEVTANLADVRLPPGITALIGARLDRLSAAERSLLGRASVMGQVFYRSALVELASENDVRTTLSALARKGLVRPAATDIPGQEALAFSHPLVRESAYGALPKAARAQLHEQYARWLDKAGEGQVYADLVGKHLEAAYASLADLGRLDDAARRLGVEASRRLEAAGRQLLFADDMAALAMLQRADQLRDDQTPEHWSLRIELITGWVRYEVNLEQAGQLAAELVDAAADPAIVVHARLLVGAVRQKRDPEGATDELLREATEALAFFTATGDHRGLAAAHEALASVATMRHQPRDTLNELQLVAHHADLAGRAREAALMRESGMASMMMGDTPAEVGLGAAVRQLTDDATRISRCRLAGCIGFFADLLDRHDIAADAWATSSRLAAELGGPLPLYATYARSRSWMAVGAWPEAAATLRQTCAFFESTGNFAVLSTEAALYAHALLHLGNVEAARVEVERAARLGSADDVLTQALAGSARGWLAALGGSAAAARDELEVALQLLPDEVLLDRAQLHLAGAEIFALLGDVAESGRHRREAISLMEAKGNVTGATRQRALLAPQAI